MATDFIAQINFRTDTSELDTTEKKLADIEDSLKNINDPNALGDVTKEFEEMNHVIDTSSLSFSEMGKAVEQYQTIALKAGAESPIGRQAIEKAAELKDQMDRVTTSVDVLSRKGVAMQTALEIGTTVTAGYGAFIGLTELAGAESEKFEKAMRKLMAVQTTLSSLEQIRNMLQKESLIMMKASVLWGKALTVTSTMLARARGTEAVATAGVTTATKVLTAAMIATGIGALIIAIGLLIANFEAVKKAVIDTANAMYDFMKPAVDFVVEGIYSIGIAEVTAEAERVKRNAEALRVRSEETQAKIDLMDAEIEAQKNLTQKATEEIDFEIQKRSAAGKDTADLEEKKIKMLIESTKKQIELSDLRNEASIKELEILAMMSGHVGDMARERLEEMKAEKVEVEKELEGLNQQLELFYIKQTKIKRDNYKKDKDAEAKAFWEAEALKNEGIQKAGARTLELKSEIANQEIAMTGKTNEELLAIYDKQIKDKQELERQAQSVKMQMTADSFSALAQLTESFEVVDEKSAKRQFQIAKAFNLSAAIVNTAQAITGALAEPSVVPGARFVKAGIAATTGAASIVKISQARFQSSGGGDSASGGGGFTSILSGLSGASSNGVGENESTNVGDLLDGGGQNTGGMQPVLVVDSFTKVDKKQQKIESLGSI